MTLTELRELADRATPGPRLRLWASTKVIAPFCEDIFDPEVAGPIAAQVNLDLAAACSPERIKAIIDAIPADPWFVCGGMIQCYSCGVKYEAGGVLGHHSDSCAWAALA